MVHYFILSEVSTKDLFGRDNQKYEFNDDMVLNYLISLMTNEMTKNQVVQAMIDECNCNVNGTFDEIYDFWKRELEEDLKGK